MDFKSTKKPQEDEEETYEESANLVKK